MVKGFGRRFLKNYVTRLESLWDLNLGVSGRFILIKNLENVDYLDDLRYIARVSLINLGYNNSKLREGTSTSNEHSREIVNYCWIRYNKK